MFGRRTHHGFYGCAVLALALMLPDEQAFLRAALVGVGATLTCHDWPDRGVWLRDFLRHPEMN